MAISTFTDFRTVYAQGQNAFSAGYDLELSGNPYAYDTILAFAYEEGFLSAKVQKELQPQYVPKYPPSSFER